MEKFGDILRNKTEDYKLQAEKLAKAKEEIACQLPPAQGCHKGGGFLDKRS